MPDQPDPKIGGAITRSVGLLHAMFPPIGSIVMFAGNDVSGDWKFCDGAALSRKLYPTLFSLIGLYYGVGDGEETFNLPNLESPIPNIRYIIRVGNGQPADQ